MCRSRPGPTWCSIVPDMIRLASYRTVYGFVSRYFRDPRLRVVMSFHPLLIGGNPFTTTSIYCLIAYLERHWGVHFAMGGTGQLVKGLVSLIEGQGGTVRCGQEVTSIIVKDAARDRRASRFGRGDRRRHRRVECRLGVDLSASAGAGCAAPLDGSQDRARALFDEPVRLVLRHEAPIPGRSASHHPARAALSRTAARHLRPQGAGRPISACICTGRPPPTPRSRRPAAMPSMCCRRCRISTAAPTGARRRRAIAARSRNISARPSCPVSKSPSSRR